MESPGLLTSSKDKTLACVVLLILFRRLAEGKINFLAEWVYNPHMPTQKWVWEFRNGITGEILINVSGPDWGGIFLTTDLCTIFKESRSFPYSVPEGIGFLPEANQEEHFLYESGYSKGCGSNPCPRQKPYKNYIYQGPKNVNYQCLRDDEYFCPQCGCETISTINNYHWDGDYYLSFKRFSTLCSVGNCNPIEFKVKNSQNHSRNTGRTWGVRLYVTGKDPGTLLTIQRKAYSLPQRPRGPRTELYLSQLVLLWPYLPKSHLFQPTLWPSLSYHLSLLLPKNLLLSLFS